MTHALTSITATVKARHSTVAQFELDRLTTSGARLSGPVTVDAGERLEILFEISGRPYEATAEVISVEHETLLIDRVVVRFVDLDPHSRDAIRALLADRSDLWGVE